MNQTVVTRYDEKGEQTKGYNKILTSLQVYEECLVDFEKHVCKKYREALDRADEPSWWQKNVKGWSKEDVVANSGLGSSEWALNKLYHWTQRDVLTQEPNWKPVEVLAFNHKVDIAQWYDSYDSLRNTIRCGNVFLIDAETTKFINEWNKRLTIFK